MRQVFICFSSYHHSTASHCLCLSHFPLYSIPCFFINSIKMPQPNTKLCTAGRTSRRCFSRRWFRNESNQLSDTHRKRNYCRKKIFFSIPNHIELARKDKVEAPMSKNQNLWQRNSTRMTPLWVCFSLWRMRDTVEVHTRRTTNTERPHACWQSAG